MHDAIPSRILNGWLRLEEDLFHLQVLSYLSPQIPSCRFQYTTLFPAEQIPKTKNAPGGLVAALRGHPMCVVPWRTRPLKRPLGRAFRLVPFWHFSTARFHVTIRKNETG